MTTEMMLKNVSQKSLNTFFEPLIRGYTQAKVSLWERRMRHVTFTVVSGH